jgi:DNA polymerase-3 subunit epsilon
MFHVPAEARGTRRSVLLWLCLAGAGVIVLGLLALLAAPDLEDGIGPAELGVFVALGAIGAGLWAAATLLEHHWAELARLSRQLQAGGAAVRPLGGAGTSDAEVAALAAAAADAIGRWQARAEQPDLRLAQVLAALPEAVLVVTATGLVSLVNGAAKAAFAGRVGVGTSIFDALDRGSFAAALDGARQAGRPLSAELRDVAGGDIPATLTALEDGGAVITCPAWQLDSRGTLEQDLRLHERAPPRIALTPDTRLDELSAVSLDIETTGLAAARDRVVSLAAVPMHGGRIFPAEAIDRLVDPGCPIPSRSRAIHGIGDEMVRGAPSIAQVLGELAPLLEGAVLIGHSIGFDRAVLRNEAERHGVPWRDPPYLDTAQLASVLLAGLPDLNLETVSAELGVSPIGRHTALGDALTAAEVYARLLPLIQRTGARSFADAEALAARAVRLRKAQREAGW